MPKKQVTRTEALKAKLSDINDSLHDAEERATEYVAEHPAKSLLTVFGIGVVVGIALTKLLEHKK